MNVRFVVVILVVVFIFFSVVAVELFMGQRRQFSARTIAEPPAHIKSLLRSQNQSNKPSAKGFSLGNTLAEKRYFRAVQKIQEDSEGRYKRRQSKRQLRKFLKTESGQYLDQGLKLLAKGQRTEARLYIEKALEVRGVLEFEVYAIMLKTLLHSYVEEKDHESLDKAVMKYLELIQISYGEDEFKKVVDELIERIEGG
jgi:hypothetical protein